MSDKQFKDYEFYPGSGGADAPCIYFIDLPEHPFNVSVAASELFCSLITLPVHNWDDALTPWAAPGLYKGNDDFGGQADATIADILDRVIPSIEKQQEITPTKRAIAGYSLGGLFALYAFTKRAEFSAVASMSGSVWYDDWIDYLDDVAFDGRGRFAFLSIGSKEKRAAPLRLHKVEENTRLCAQLLESRGVNVRHVVGPGSHIQHTEERLQAGFAALDEALRS